MVSVSAMECPGAARCPSGDVCFAEAARERAGQADVVVVNTHLYATHLATGGAILPAHDVVIFDEAHELEDVASASLGLELGAGRFAALARNARPLVGDAAVAAGGRRRRRPARRAPSNRTGASGSSRPLPEDGRAGRHHGPASGSPALGRALRASDGDAARKARAQQAAGHLAGDLDAVARPCPTTHVAWVEGPPATPRPQGGPGRGRRRCSTRLLWQGEDGADGGADQRHHPAQAGRPARPARRLVRRARRRQPVRLRPPGPAVLRGPPARPPHARPTKPAMHDELEALDPGGRRPDPGPVHQLAGHGAGGRGAAERPAVAGAHPGRPAQAGAGRSRSGDEEHSCLFATMGFWQGVDVPGPALSLVTIDRIPFPRPDEPLLQARRDRLGRGRLRPGRPAPGRHPAGPGRRPADPVISPTGAWSPCSTPGWPRPATAGTWSGPCRPCAAPAPARRRGISCASANVGRP